MTTRDGVTLRADVHGPSEPGRYPVLMVRAPYGKQASPYLRDLLDHTTDDAYWAALDLRLVMGPWAHLLGYAKPGTRGAGEADFGPEAAIDLHAIQRDRFDHFFRGTPLGAPRVRIFVLGENRWRDEDDWPLARRVETPLYLRAGGSLSWEPPGDDEDPPTATSATRRTRCRPWAARRSPCRPG